MSADVQGDYDRLGVLLEVEEDGSKAAALVRERRMLRALLEGDVEEVSFVDELAERRRTGTEDPGPAPRRRRSRGG